MPGRHRAGEAAPVTRRYRFLFSATDAALGFRGYSPMHGLARLLAEHFLRRIEPQQDTGATGQQCQPAATATHDAAAFSGQGSVFHRVTIPDQEFAPSGRQPRQHQDPGDSHGPNDPWHRHGSPGHARGMDADLHPPDPPTLAILERLAQGDRE